MRHVERDDWGTLCCEAEEFVWRVLDGYDARCGVQLNRTSEAIRSIFLLELNVAGRFRCDARSGPAYDPERHYRCFLAGGSGAEVRTCGTVTAGLVALAASAAPAGRWAPEALALGTSMLAIGMTLLPGGP